MPIPDFIRAGGTWANLDPAWAYSPYTPSWWSSSYVEGIDEKAVGWMVAQGWMIYGVTEDVNGQYDGWVRSDHMRTTPGNVIDVDKIESDTMEEIVAPFDLQELAVDPGHNSTQYGVHMAQEGLTVVDVRPSVLNFSEAMKWLEAYVKDGTFHHNCPVLTWMISNVEVKRDFKDNIYPRKGAVNRKIDGVIALLMALNRMKLAEDGNSTIYDTRGVITT